MLTPKQLESLQALDRVCNNDDASCDYVLDRVLADNARHTRRAVERLRQREHAVQLDEFTMREALCVSDKETSLRYVEREFAQVLSPMQRTVLAGKMEGMSYRDIANVLKCSHAQVKRIFEKTKRILLQNAEVSAYISRG